MAEILGEALEMDLGNVRTVLVPTNDAPVTSVCGKQGDVNLKTSDLQNDAGYIKADTAPGKLNYVNTVNPIQLSGDAGRNNVVWLDGGVRLAYLGDIDTYFTLLLAKPLEAGKTYTLSFLCSGADNLKNAKGQDVDPPTFRMRSNNTTLVANLNLQNGRISVTFTPSAETSSTILFDDVPYEMPSDLRPYNSDIVLTEWQIEEGNTVTPYHPSTPAAENEIRRIDSLTCAASNSQGWEIGLVDEHFVTAGRRREFENATFYGDTESGAYCRPSPDSDPYQLPLPFPVARGCVTCSVEGDGVYYGGGGGSKSAAPNGGMVHVDFRLYAHKAHSAANAIANFVLADRIAEPPKVPTIGLTDPNNIGAAIVSVAETYVAATNPPDDPYNPGVNRQFAYGTNFFYNNSDLINDDQGRGKMECDTFVGIVLRGVPYASSPYADTTPGKTYSYDTFMAATAAGVPSWATAFRAKLGLTSRMLGRDARFAGDLAQMLWMIDGTIFSDEAYARPGDVAFWRDPQRDTKDMWFDAITHVAILGEREDGYLTIYEVTGASDSGGRVLQHVSLKNRARQPAYFARPYGWAQEVT